MQSFRNLEPAFPVHMKQWPDFIKRPLKCLSTLAGVSFSHLWCPSDSHLYDRPSPALGLSALNISLHQGKNEWEQPQNQEQEDSGLDDSCASSLRFSSA